MPNQKTETTKKRSLKEGTEYRSGMYFGNTGEILNRPQRDITRDVSFLSRKTLGHVPDGQDLKSICEFYKTKLME